MKGFVLLTVLIFMQILAILSIFSFKIVGLDQKFLGQDKIHRVAGLYEKAILGQIEKNLSVEKPLCNIATISSHELAQKTIDWWNSTGCPGKMGNFQYFYVVEALGLDPCAYLYADSDIIADYYRVSVFISESNSLYQSTVILPFSMTPSCDGMKHIVKLGQQMKREIS